LIAEMVHLQHNVNVNQAPVSGGLFSRQDTQFMTIAHYTHIHVIFFCITHSKEVTDFVGASLTA